MIHSIERLQRLTEQVLLFGFAVLLSGVSFAQAEFVPPRMSEPVVDQAGVISPARTAQLNQLLRNLHQSGGSQIGVLTIANLNGVSIEEAGIKTGDAWQLGRKGKDDGVILLVAPNDRKVRIEVGRGREGDLTDAYSRRIIREIIAPAFKAGDFDSGIVHGVAAIVSVTDPQFSLDALGSQTQRMRRSSGEGASGNKLLRSLFVLLFFGIFLLLQFVRMLGLGGSRFGRSGGYWGGGGGFGGGGFGGGGGWGGGGGGFGGGGSSGSW